jgi:hypothetical protein
MNEVLTAESRDWLASTEEQDPAIYPELYNLSAAFLFRFLARPDTAMRPEFLYVPVGRSGKSRLELTGIIGEWNLAWETAQLRPVTIGEREECKKILAEILPDLSTLKDRNVYLVPDTKKRFDAFPLYAMLPVWVLRKYGLPPIRKMLWPVISPLHALDFESWLPFDFRERLSRAFATYIWTFIGGKSSLGAFDLNESLCLLSHNLDFWLPHATRVAEERLSTSDFVELESAKDRKDLERIREAIPREEPVTIDRCRKGGSIWCGEMGAREATSEMIENADKWDRLRSLIDAIRSNRVEEDFSERWSYAREDFERKLYRKRSRIRVKFVELSEAEGVVGPQAEIADRQIWQDFFALLNVKEQEIVVCIAKGETNLTEAARLLGYANHSPLSKALARIRKKAQSLFDG